MKIICDSNIPFIKGVLEPYAEMVYMPGHEIDSTVVRDADALIVRTRTQCNAQLLSGSKVRFIATATIGYDHIDTEWCKANGITWCNAPGCNSGAVYQYMGSLLVALIKRFTLNAKELTLGVVGVGNVGSKVARMAALLGFNPILCDPPRARSEGLDNFVSLDDIISRCDIISCHVPLTASGKDATWHLFDQERISSMHNGQILINTSRGEVVDGQALKNALVNGSIKAASFDVWENEPHIDTELLPLLFTGTPHIAGYSTDGKARATTMCVQALANYFNLPCSEWRPQQIPKPLQPQTITLDAGTDEPRSLLGSAIMYSYNIMEDDSALRRDTRVFESLRSSYPVRREFESYTVNVKNDSSGRTTALLREAGFNVNN